MAANISNLSLINGTNITDSEDDYEPWVMPEEERIADLLWKYLPPILFVIGTIGNTLAFMVFSRKSISSSSVSTIYLRALTILDMFALWGMTFPPFIASLFDIWIDIHSSFTCKLRNFLVMTSTCCASWTLTFMTVERFTAVTFPHKAKIYFTRKRVVLSLVILCITMSLIWSGNWYYWDKYTWYDPLGDVWYSYCGSRRGGYYSRHISTNLFLVLYVFAPFAIMLFCNIGIIYNVAKSQRMRQTMHGGNQQESQTKSLTALLLTVSFAFMLLGLPNCVYIAIQHIWSHVLYGTKEYGQLWLTYQTTNIMLHMNHSLNFFLYCISGSRFRKELFIMFGCAKLVKPTGGSSSQSKSGTNITSVQ